MSKVPLPPRDAMFPELADYLYFQGQSLLDHLIHGVTQFHHAGPEYAGRSREFLEHVTNRLGKMHEPKDMKNALAVIFADIVANDARTTAGTLSAMTLQKRWGPAAGFVLRQALSVEGIDAHRRRPRDPVTLNELVRSISIYAPHRMPEYLATLALPERLPLIEYLKPEVGPASRIRALVCVQHLFGSTIPLITALAAKQVEPSGVFILGKPYSTNHATMWLLREHGYYVHPGSTEFNGNVEYHEEVDRYLESLLFRCCRWYMANRHHEQGRILLLDDGGRAIRMLHRDVFRDVLSHVTCVEQTRRGVRELDDIELRVPVINVAESRAKLDHESPIIAASVRNELLKRLEQLHAAGIVTTSSALIIGYGAIGAAVAHAMHVAHWQVGVFDRDLQRIQEAESAGLRAERSIRDALASYQVVIGCTGTPVIDFEDYGFIRDGTLLVSASSSDVEFNSWKLRSLAASFQGDHRYVDEFNLVHERFGDRLLYLGDRQHPCHFLYVVRFRGRRFFLLNGGFPVNMNGEVDPIPAEQIQLTRALLYVGAVQASHEVEPGLHDIKEESQSKLISKFHELRRTQAASECG